MKARLAVVRPVAAVVAASSLLLGCVTLGGCASGLGAKVATSGVPIGTSVLRASDGEPNDAFGMSVAVDGDTALVGAFRRHGGEGAAYLLSRSGGTWKQTTSLTDPSAAPDDEFGRSVALSGDTAVIGADGRDGHAGAVFVFTRSGSAWTRTATLTASDRGGNDVFGQVLALSGDELIIGAGGKDSNRGAAYLFTRSGRTWTQQAKLTASDSAANDEFSADSVAVSGDTAVVGGWGGAVYVFTRAGDTWKQSARLAPADSPPSDQFGHGVALAGDTLVMGACHHDKVRGAVHVYTHTRGAWTHTATLTAGDGAEGDAFGYLVALSDGSLLVDAPQKDAMKGVAYLFARHGTEFTQRAKLVAATRAVSDYFGASIALSGDTAMVGAPGRDSTSGVVCAFTAK